VHQPADARGPAGGHDRAGALDVGVRVLGPRAGDVDLRGQVQHGVLAPDGPATTAGSATSPSTSRQGRPGRPALQHGHLVAASSSAVAVARPSIRSPR
jgi:hypothetical protein